jgi:hypothetical protein
MMRIALAPVGPDGEAAGQSVSQFIEIRKFHGTFGTYEVCFSSDDKAVDAAFRMAFGGLDLTETVNLAAAKCCQGYQAIHQMTNSDRTHPLGDEETDQIDPAVAQGLTPAQLEWLCTQSDLVGRKKLQILRQALFEWVGEHLEYRFNEAGFGDTVQQALEEFMNRHGADVLRSEPKILPVAAKVSEPADRSE